jgi:hypothetical protein
MPTYIKSYVGNINSESKSTVLNDDEKVNSNNFLDFNPNVGLRARLYQKNKDLMDKVLAKDNKIENSEPRDSLLDLLDSRKEG